MILDDEQCQRAAAARDPRFDGVFFIGVASTGIYCRPICPARVSIATHRRFFVSAAAAEHAGYRPCLRCRPELAPGRAPVDAVARLAVLAAARIAAGALNGRSVDALARELGVSARHLRRALAREVGVSPVELAQTHRLLLAKRLLADTDLPVTEVAYASGYQSLRRFNAAFRERYRLAPSALRRGASVRARTAHEAPADPFGGFVRLTLAYRPPFDWPDLLRRISARALPGAELVHGERYGRTLHLVGHRGVVFVAPGGRRAATRPGELEVRISLSLLPVLMPLLARLRHAFDLDADPLAIDDALAAAGLADSVAAHPGLRLLGGLDGFEVALAELLGEPGRDATVAARVVRELGEPISTGFAALHRLAPDAACVAAAGAPGLAALGVSQPTAAALHAVAQAMAAGALVLAPGGDVDTAVAGLCALGVPPTAAVRIAARALYWPDAFTADDPVLQHGAGASSALDLARHAEGWRPWRAYAALHLERRASSVASGTAERAKVAIAAR